MEEDIPTVNIAPFCRNISTRSGEATSVWHHDVSPNRSPDKQPASVLKPPLEWCWEDGHENVRLTGLNCTAAVNKSTLR